MRSYRDSVANIYENETQNLKSSNLQTSLILIENENELNSSTTNKLNKNLIKCVNFEINKFILNVPNQLKIPNN